MFIWWNSMTLNVRIISCPYRLGSFKKSKIVQCLASSELSQHISIASITSDAHLMPLKSFFHSSNMCLWHPSLIFSPLLLFFLTLFSSHHPSTYRIREVADKLNKYGTHTFSALHSLKIPVKQVVVGNSYLGILLADGRAFRVAYSVIAERLDLSKHDSSNKK